MKKKLLVLGISGLTGYKIAKTALSKFEVYGTFNTRKVEIPNINIEKIDVTNPDKVNNIFSEIKPDFVINTTALHNVDYCEEHKEEAHKVNYTAVSLMLKNSDKFGSKLVHFSTDYIFDGKQHTPYLETDEANPLSYYGTSKLDGEKLLYQSTHSIIRPSVVYGWTPLELAGTPSSSGKPINFAMWLLTKLHAGENLKIVTDQFATATLADSLAKAALKIAESKKGGIYHVVGLSCESRFEFSQKLAKEFGFNENQIQPTDSSQFKQKAKRPSYSCLNSNKAVKEFDLDLQTTENALKIMKNQVEKEAPHLLTNSNR